MNVPALLRSAHRHARNSRKLAQESRELAVAAMVEAARCQRIAASINETVDATMKQFNVMQAARPYLELAELNAELAESFARDAAKYRDKVRELALSMV